MADHMSTGVKITASTDEFEKKLELLTSKTARYISSAKPSGGSRGTVWAVSQRAKQACRGIDAQSN